MLTASSEGDLETMKDLASRQPALVRCEYNYTPPIHFAVREGHAPVVSWLIEQGVDLSYRSYSFKDALLQMAREREYHDILQILETHGGSSRPRQDGTAAGCRQRRRLAR
tara:strand:+ start:111 stop:440 length:330 start_codon:yes stop_codon:yes gene_type:complete